MRRWLLILGLLICTAQAWASGNTPYTTCGPDATTSCTWAAAPLPNSTILCGLYDGTAATAPTVPTGFTTLKSETGDTNAAEMIAKYALGNETTESGFTHATVTFCEDYTGTFLYVTTTGAAGGLGLSFGANASGAVASTSSTSLSYATFTLSNPLGTSWVVCVGGASSSTAGADVAPTGQTNRSGTSIVTYNFSDTNGAVSSWSTTAQTYTTASHNATACIELVGQPSTMSDMSSNIVFETWPGDSQESCTGVCTTTIPVSSSLSNNYLKVSFCWAYGTTAPTVSNIYANSDTTHATWTWTLLKSLLDTTDKWDCFVYRIAGATAGVTSVSVVASSVWTDFKAHYIELNGVATSSTEDITTIGQTSTTEPYSGPGSSGALNTSGDLVIEECYPVGNNIGSQPQQGIVSASTNIASDDQLGMSEGGFLYSSTTAITVGNWLYGMGVNSNCFLEALKTSAGAGTAASGVHVKRLEARAVGEVSPAIVQTHQLVAGNALVIAVDGSDGNANAVQWSAVSDALGQTINSYQSHDANGGYTNFAVVCNQKAGDNNFSFTNATGADNEYWIMEVEGLNNTSSTSCFDASAGIGGCTTGGSAVCTNGAPVQAGTCTGSSSPYTCTPLPTISPSVSGGIVIQNSELGDGVPLSCSSPTGVFFANAIYTGQTDGSKIGQGNFMSWLINPSATSLTFTCANGASTGSDAMAIHLLAASVSTVVRHRAEVTGW